MALDPTELNRQGPDEGTQYRSAIFYGNDEQKRIAEAYIAQLDQAKAFPRPIVTQVVALKAFYPAETYHQNYATLASRQPVHPVQRSAEGGAPAGAVSESLPGEHCRPLKSLFAVRFSRITVHSDLASGEN